MEFKIQRKFGDKQNEWRLGIKICRLLWVRFFFLENLTNVTNYKY